MNYMDDIYAIGDTYIYKLVDDDYTSEEILKVGNDQYESFIIFDLEDFESPEQKLSDVGKAMLSIFIKHASSDTSFEIAEVTDDWDWENELDLITWSNKPETDDPFDTITIEEDTSDGEILIDITESLKDKTRDDKVAFYLQSSEDIVDLYSFEGGEWAEDVDSPSIKFYEENTNNVSLIFIVILIVIIIGIIAIVMILLLYSNHKKKYKPIAISQSASIPVGNLNQNIPQTSNQTLSSANNCPYCEEKLDESGTQAYCRACGAKLMQVNASLAYVPQSNLQNNQTQNFSQQPQVYGKNMAFCPYCNEYVHLTKKFSWLTFCCCLWLWYFLFYCLKPSNLCPNCHAKLK